MHIITFPDKRTLAGFVEAQGLDEGVVYWRGATEHLANPPPRATEPQLVAYMKDLAKKTGGTLQEVPQMAEPPSPPPDNSSKLILRYLNDHGEVEVTDEIHPGLLFSAKKTQASKVVEIRVKDILPAPPAPVPKCLAGKPENEVIGQKLGGSTHTVIFETPLDIDKEPQLEIEGDPIKYVIEDVVEKNAGATKVRWVKATGHSAEPTGYKFDDSAIRDWFQSKDNPNPFPPH
jgi:hypothetical protein